MQLLDVGRGNVEVESLVFLDKQCRLVRLWLACKGLAHLWADFVTAGPDGRANPGKQLGRVCAIALCHPGDGTWGYQRRGATPPRMHEGEGMVPRVVEQDWSTVTIGPTQGEARLIAEHGVGLNMAHATLHTCDSIRTVLTRMALYDRPCTTVHRFCADEWQSQRSDNLRLVAPYHCQIIACDGAGVQTGKGWCTE